MVLPVVVDDSTSIIVILLSTLVSVVDFQANYYWNSPSLVSLAAMATELAVTAAANRMKLVVDMPYTSSSSFVRLVLLIARCAYPCDN